jgi:site-specific DNA recombinase
MKAAGYVRVSTSMQAERGLSPEEQRHAIEDFAAEQRWQLVGIYEDSAISGSLEERPGLSGLREVVAAGEVDVVLTRDMDRLARNLVLALGIAGEFAVANVRIYELAKGAYVETDTPEQELNFNIGAAVAQFQRKQIGRNVSRSMPGRVKKGRHLGAPVYGYRKTADGYEPDAAQAAAVNRIFEDFAAGEPVFSISRALNVEGVPTRNGGQWHPQTLRAMLRNRFFIGEVRYRDEWHPGQHDGIISPELFAEVQGRIERETTTATDSKGRTLGNRGRPSHRALLAQRLYCGHCGRRMNVRGDRDQYTCATRYQRGPNACPQRPIPRAAVDGAVFAYFEEMGLDREATRAQLQEVLDGQLARVLAERTAAERDEQTAAARLERVRRHYQDGKIAPDDWAEQREQLTSELTAAQAKAERLRAREQELTEDRPFTEAEAALDERLEALRAALAGADDAADLQGARMALDRVFEGFTIFRTDAQWLPGEQEAAERARAEMGGAPLTVETADWTVSPQPRYETIEALGEDWQPVFTRQSLPLGANDNYRSA